MILGIGTDIVDMRRIEHLINAQGERFINRIYTEQEQDYAKNAQHPQRRLSRYANRFAAKEATMKALGSTENVSWHDIEVFREEHKPPTIRLSGAAKEIILARLLPDHKMHILLSLSDEHPYSVAFVTISAMLTA